MRVLEAHDAFVDVVLYPRDVVHLLNAVYRTIQQEKNPIVYDELKELIRVLDGAADHIAPHLKEFIELSGRSGSVLRP
jgi:hypothetical protein